MLLLLLTGTAAFLAAAGPLVLIGVGCQYLMGCWLYRHRPYLLPAEMQDYDLEQERSTAFWRPLTRGQNRLIRIALTATALGIVVLWAVGTFWRDSLLRSM